MPNSSRSTEHHFAAKWSSIRPADPRSVLREAIPTRGRSTECRRARGQLSRYWTDSGPITCSATLLGVKVRLRTRRARVQTIRADVSAVCQGDLVRLNLNAENPDRRLRTQPVKASAGFDGGRDGLLNGVDHSIRLHIETSIQ